MQTFNEETNDGEENNIENFGRIRDGFIKNPNPYLNERHQIYPHLGILNTNFVEQLGDVKFVCMGGTPFWMEKFASYFQALFGVYQPDQINPINSRCSIYKFGPILFVSTGIGSSSMSVVLTEIIKLMYYAKIKDPVLFRVGSCGGIGLKDGTVVITEDVIDGMMNSCYEVPMLGEIVKRRAKLDSTLVQDLKALSSNSDLYSTISGTTMCTSDFYEGQGRLDGAFCEYKEDKAKEYINKLYTQGVVNMEMQGIPFAAITHHAGIRAAIVCVSLTDKLNNNQNITATFECYMRPIKLVARYIRHYLQLNDLTPEDLEYRHGLFLAQQQS